MGDLTDYREQISKVCNCQQWARVNPIDLRGYEHHSQCPEFKLTYYVRITLVGGRSYIQPIDELGALQTEIQEAAAAQEPSEWTVELVEMSHLEYAKLLPFEGH